MHVTLVIGALCLVAGAAAAPKEKLFKRVKDAPPPLSLAQSSPTFDSFRQLGFDSNVQKSNKDLLALSANKLGFSPFDARQGFGNVVDLQGIGSGNLPGVAPIPVPGFPGPQDVPAIPGVNTIPGLDTFNYLIGQLIPQSVPPANSLLGGSLARLLPQDSTKNLAKDIFKSLHDPLAPIETERMMGRWFQVINSPHVIREACTVSHFGALTNNTYSASFTILKFYREGNPNGPPRFSLGYGFKVGDSGQFVIHNSNSADSEPFWVVKVGPLNEYNQYDYAIVSNWVKFPIFVIARDPSKFKEKYMREVLEYLEANNYINFLTKAFNMIAPVEYGQCQYTPTFSSAG